MTHAPHPVIRSRLARRAGALALTLALVATASSIRPAAADDHQPVTAVELRALNVLSLSVVGPGPVDGVHVGSQATATVDEFLRLGVLEGLATGAPADVAVQFTLDGASRLASDQRGLLIEEGTPRPALVAVERSDAEITILAGGGGAELVVVAINHEVAALGGAAGALRVTRTGSVVLAPADGTWKIDSYDLKVERRRDPLPPLADLWVLGGAA